MTSLRSIVQRVVQAREHAHGVAERGMRRDVLDALAVDPDLAAVAQALEVFRGGERLRALRGCRVFCWRGHTTLLRAAVMGRPAVRRIEWSVRRPTPAGLTGNRPGLADSLPAGRDRGLTKISNSAARREAHAPAQGGTKNNRRPDRSRSWNNSRGLSCDRTYPDAATHGRRNRGSLSRFGGGARARRDRRDGGTPRDDRAQDTDLNRGVHCGCSWPRIS